ncbi:MAG: radical SAM protein [Theionarchaea archaeon]|nr:radical SAM protein [Theionarchaea archaeon]
MKQSHYNVLLPLGEEMILYNTMSSALLIIDKDIQHVLQTGEGLPNVVDTLYSHGFLVDDDFDEKVPVQIYIDADWCRVPFGGYRDTHMGNMEFLNMIITHECNLNCSYCYKLFDPCSGHMKEDVVQKSAAFAGKEIEKNSLNTLFLSLYGGEPLVNRKITDYAVNELQAVCDEWGVVLMVKLFTNGTLLDEPFLDTFSQNNIADIHLTFDAPESIHDERRVFPNGRSSFNAVLKAAQLIEDRKINLILRINISKEKLNVLPLLQKLREEGVRKAHLYFGMAEPRMDYCTHYYSSYGFPGDSDLFFTLSNEAAKTGFYVLPSEIGLNFSLCASTSDYIHMVNTDGFVYKCMSLIGHKNHAVGSLKSDGILDKTPVYTKWVQKNPLTIPGCRECVLLPKCMGGCTAIAWREHKTYNAPGCFTVDFSAQLYNSEPVKAYIGTSGNTHSSCHNTPLDDEIKERFK